MNRTGKSFKSNVELKEKKSSNKLINLNNSYKSIDSFSAKQEENPRSRKAHSRSRLVMLPHGVIEDTKGEDNASEDAANFKRRNSKIEKD